MDPPEITDAARLTANAPPSGVLPPREATFGTAWLDLRSRTTRVALGETARVVRALATSLVLREEARLLVSSGITPGRMLASVAAESLCRAEQQGTLIAVVRGDDALARLEEFALADPQALGERWRSASAAWAIPTAAILREAAEQNAAITFSHPADEGVIRLASLPEGDQEEPPGRLVLRIVTGRLLAVFLPVEEERLRREAERHAPDGCDWRLEPCADGALFVAESAGTESLREFAQRLALVLPGTPTPLGDQIIPVYDDVEARVDPELLDFALDIRPASEWVAD